MDTPVLFLIFNRPDTTKMVFDAIGKIKPKRLYIAADGPRAGRDDDRKNCAAVKDIVSMVDWDCEVKTLFREKNLGCKMAISSAISWFFENVEEGIILEDDCVPDQSFFPFCQMMLKRYRDDKRIMMVTGMNYFFNNIEIPESYFFSKYYPIWGWATWRRAWKFYDMYMLRWNYYNRNNYLGSIYEDKGMVDFFKNMFQEAFENKIDTWDIQWVYTCIFENGMCITPKYNLISNIGIQGTHTMDVVSLVNNMPVKQMNFQNMTHPINVTPNVELDKIAFNFILGKTKKLKFRNNYKKIKSRGTNFIKKNLKIFESPEIDIKKISAFIKNHKTGIVPDQKKEKINTLGIVIPCYNHGKYLEQMFSSVINQTRPPDNVIFVNDGSQDDTLKILNKLINGYKDKVNINFNIINNETNIGQAASLNKAIDQVNTDLVMILNDDDYLFHDIIEVMFYLFNKYNEVYMIGNHSIHFRNDDHLNLLKKLVSDLVDYNQINLSIHTPEMVMNYKKYNDLNMTHSGSTFYKSAFKACGGYRKKDERIVPFSDRDFQLRMNALFPVGVSYDIPFVFWRNDSSVDREFNS